MIVVYNTFFFLCLASDLDRALSDLRKVAREDVISPSPATPRNASICIDVDDSLAYESPFERDIIVKVRTRHGIKRFPMKAVCTAVFCLLDL